MSVNVIATDGDVRIQPGCEVTLHFSLMLSSGEEIDTTRNAEPAKFVVGDGNLLPGFEAALLGKTKGYAEQVLLKPADAFGERNEDNVQVLSKDKFSDVLETLEVGLMISFGSPEGELPGVVTDVYERTIKVDFNHPLSGREIVFDVAVLDVKVRGCADPYASGK